MDAALSLESVVRRLRFKHLQLLEILMRTRNLHVTAQQMNLTQPAVTKILHNVEDVFGFPIFERLPGDMRPTAMGELVIRHAQLTLGATARFVDEIVEVSGGRSGKLMIGAILGAADIVAKSIAELKKRRPLLFIHLLARTSDQLLVELAEHRLDVVIGRFSAADQPMKFDFRTVMSEPLWVVVNGNHPLRTKRRLSLSQLVDWPWILQPHASPMRQLLEEEFALAGVKTPADVIETISIFGTLQLLQASPAIAVLPGLVARNYVESKMLVRLPITFHRELGEWGILTRKNEVLFAATAEFVGLLTQPQARAGLPHATPKRSSVGRSGNAAATQLRKSRGSGRAR